MKGFIISDNRQLVVYPTKAWSSSVSHIPLFKVRVVGMPAFRNVGPSRRSLSFDRDQDHFEQTSNIESSSTFVANSSISARTISTSRLSIRDSAADGAPVAKRPRLILHGPKKDANREQSQSITPIATPEIYRASPGLVLSNDSKQPAALHVTPNGRPVLHKTPRLKKRHKDYIPRPKNPFILFRSEFYQKFTQGVNEESLKSLDQANLSQQAASKWNSLSEEEKKPYMLRAAEEKKAHAVMYPGYSYSPDKKKSKSPRKTSKTLLRKARNDNDEIVKPSPSLPPLGSHPQSTLTPASSSPTSFSLQPASWGRQDDTEPGSRTNPITESSPYMMLSNEEVLGSTRVTKPGVTNERAIHRSQVISNHPIHLSHTRDSTVSQLPEGEPTDNPNASHSSTSATMAPDAISAPRIIRPPFSLTTEAPELTNLSGQSLWSSDVPFPFPSDPANGQFANPPKASTSGVTPRSLGSVQIPETRIAGPSIALGAESTAPLVPHQVADNPFTETLSSLMEELGEHGLDNAFYLEYERRFATSSFCMPEELPIVSPTILHDRRTNKYTTPHSHVVPKDLPPSSPTTTPHRRNCDPMVGKPLTVPHTMSDLECKRNFSTSWFRIESEEPPTVQFTMLEDERRCRFLTSRFRAMSEELPSIPPTATSYEHRRSSRVEELSATAPTMSALERKRAFATSSFRTVEDELPMTISSITPLERKRRFATFRFRIMSEEPPPATLTRASLDYRGRFATSRFRSIPKKSRLSLLQRTSRFLSSRIYRSNGSTFSHRHRLLGLELSPVTSYISRGAELGFSFSPSPPPFPPLQFTAGNVPKAFSVRILGLNFITC
ncbi:hypothetical protein BDZ94DRAFT_899763 [Collybia nuda]|uniref:HMG box domain-containing protein n=1 Tax=Collybia nuda TaxID=64659 RepID=A0A9P5YFI3_9AGAR|nr:hypothetical protein BDZ94DRAFT_899763 [Collybia nuda]